MAITVDVKRCPQNHPCPSVQVCPVGALIQQGYKAPQVHPIKCTECLKCVKFCPMGALQFQKGN